TLLVDDDELAVSDLAVERRADEVEGARLRRDHAIAPEPTEAERAEPVRVTERHQLPLGERDDGERTLESRHGRRDRVLERRGIVGDQRRDQLAVGGRVQRDVLRVELFAQLRRVDQVAVVAERDRADASVLNERLRVRPLRRARGRVAVVADRDLYLQAAQLLLVEDLAHEPEVAQRREASVVGDGDSGRLLPTVLKREEAEVRQPGHVPAGRVNAEDPAHQGTWPIWTKPFEPSLVTWEGAMARTAAPRRGSSGRSTSASSPPLHPAASASACASPPAPTSCARPSSGAAFQRKRISAASAASESSGATASRTASPERQRDGTKRTSGTSPTQPTTGVGGIGRPSVSLYSETLPETTGMPSASAAWAIPSIACASSQPISGFSGLAKLRQSVKASGRPPAQATLRAASSTAPAPAAKGSSSPIRGPSSETASPR